MANSPQTGTQTKESKLRFKITVKMLRISQCPWAACKTWSSNEFFSAAVLKQRKKGLSKKSKHRSGSGTFCIILIRILTVPHWACRGRLEVFQSSKRGNFDQRMLFNGSHGFLRFFTRFSTQKVYFHSKTTRTPFGLPKPNLHECWADFSKIRLLCFIKAVKIINSAPLKNSRGFV